ncbi:hypothetical protein EVAR_95393_1 [Eumeta japonica]|uniref:Uncharacterized protein n=1 Tax=Eumeta variegata TaxID=151549 RepID=A0A4C1VIM0_EUMVA|nr:hypothetical protein EVAR_95393_1 [Eumeta japonica]
MITEQLMTWMAAQSTMPASDIHPRYEKGIMISDLKTPIGPPRNRIYRSWGRSGAQHAAAPAGTPNLLPRKVGKYNDLNRSDFS